MELFCRREKTIEEDKAAIESAELETRIACEKDEDLLMRICYAQYLETSDIQKKSILYQSGDGTGMTGGPLAMFQYLIAEKEFQKYQHIWIISGWEENAFTVKKYMGNTHVLFVKKNTDEYWKWLASAKYLVCDAEFPASFSKRKEQVYIHTGFGIPDETQGICASEGKIVHGNTMRNLLAVDYLASANSKVTACIRTSYKLDGIFKGKILETGDPSVDNYGYMKRGQIEDELLERGIDIDLWKKIILYVATGRAKNQDPADKAEECLKMLNRLENGFDKEQFQVLMKIDGKTYNYIKEQTGWTGQFVSQDVDIDQLMPIAYVIITNDTADRALMDIEQYSIEYHEKLDKWLDERGKKKDSKVCARVAQTVFGKKDLQKAVQCDHTDKKKLLLYGGVLTTNGITFSFLTLLNHIDYEKYDVTVLARAGKDPVTIERIKNLPDKVRVLYQEEEVYTPTLEENARHMLIMERGLDAGILAPVDFYKRELCRMFGSAEFDYVVEFTGYNKLYAVLFSHMQKCRKLIWMHNDLKKELDRKSKGGRDVGGALQVCFSAYPYMDKLVGCSKSCMEVNKKNLANEKTADKFTYMRNLVNYERIIHEKEDRYLSIGEKNYYCKNIRKESDYVEIETVPVPDKNQINFVSMGRLSPEKNHENLILAFSRLYHENPNIRLYILGEGLLRPHLEEVIRKENMEGKVMLVGALENPFHFLKACQCFVLPSYYEGQPLVIQEARVLKLPIIVSKFSSVKDVLIENGQLMIEQDADSIYSGLKSYAEGKVPVYEFDAENYNKQVYPEFEQLLKA